MAVFCVCVSIASPSSQEKAWYQRKIKDYKEVSDEYSIRVVHVAHSIPDVCVLCVQYIASRQSGIEDPNTSEERRRQWLKNAMQVSEIYIQHYKLQIDKCETEIKQITAIENKGESIILLLYNNS